MSLNKFLPSKFQTRIRNSQISKCNSTCWKIYMYRWFNSNVIRTANSVLYTVIYFHAISNIYTNPLPLPSTAQHRLTLTGAAICIKVQCECKYVDEHWTPVRLPVRVRRYALRDSQVFFFEPPTADCTTYSTYLLPLRHSPNRRKHLFTLCNLQFCIVRNWNLWCKMNTDKLCSCSGLPHFWTGYANEVGLKTIRNEFWIE